MVQIRRRTAVVGGARNPVVDEPREESSGSLKPKPKLYYGSNTSRSKSMSSSKWKKKPKYKFSPGQHARPNVLQDHATRFLETEKH